MQEIVDKKLETRAPRRKKALFIIGIFIALVIIGSTGDDIDSSKTSSIYKIKSDGVYAVKCLDCWTRTYEKIYDSDPVTFKTLDHPYALDKNYVYIRGRAIPNADPNTFKLVGSKNLAIDENNIFLYDEIIAGKPDSLKVIYDLGDALYFQTDHGVFYKGRLITDANKETFRVIGPSFSLDDQKVYCHERIIIDANPNTFTSFITKDVDIFGYPISTYGKDEKFAYFCSPFFGSKIVRIEDTDIESFTAENMSKSSAKDKYSEYYFHGIFTKDESSDHKITSY